jgi:transglutaminase-like putative cysteine protease
MSKYARRARPPWISRHPWSSRPGSVICRAAGTRAIADHVARFAAIATGRSRTSGTVNGGWEREGRGDPDAVVEFRAPRRPAAGPLDIAERICAAVHAALAYQHGVTDVKTTAATALAAGRGVCQDAAHIMVALCRLAQLPARYVSGHLLGQGGMHAWVEVIVPYRDAAMAVPFDPCHGHRTDNGYVTVAVGRDYADVAPTSGSYMGPPGGQLTSVRRVGVVSVDTPL